MPTPNKGESEKDYVTRCIPIVLNEGTAEDSTQAAAICHSMYKEHKKTKANMEEINFKATIEKVETSDSEWVEVELVACKGDFFLQNDFVPNEVLKASAEKWNGTIHDISHMATNYPHGLNEEENIEYVIGYNKLKSYDESTKELRITSYIRKNSPKFQAWENYIAVCKASGKIPNVSISALAKRKLINASDIPHGVKIPDKWKNSSKIVAVDDFLPLGITTCMLGKCNDSDGCGIILKGNDNCSDGSCNLDDYATKRVREEKEKMLEERKEYLRKRINQIEKI